MTTQMIIRIPEELKNRAGQLAQTEGKTLSLVVRELLEGYARSRDMSSYVDDLWLRIAKAATGGDVERAVREVRNENPR